MRLRRIRPNRSYATNRKMKSIVKNLLERILAHPSWSGAGVVITVLLAILQCTATGNKPGTTTSNAWYVGDWRIDAYRTIDNLEGDMKKAYSSLSQDDIMKFANTLFPGRLNAINYPKSLDSNFNKKEFIALAVNNIDPRFRFKNSELHITSNENDIRLYHSNVDGIQGKSIHGFYNGSGYASSIKEISDDTAVIRGKTTEETLDCDGRLNREEREQTATIKKLNEAMILTTNVFIQTRDCSPENGHQYLTKRPVLKLFLRRY